MSNITQIVNGEKNMTILKQGVVASGLNQILSGNGPFTLFAPSDLAFGKLDKKVLEGLLNPENKVQLTDVLKYHVVSGKINYKDLKEGDKLKTANGKELYVHVKDGTVNIDGAVVNNHEIQTSNGVIYSVDKVMMKNSLIK